MSQVIFLSLACYIINKTTRTVGSSSGERPCLNLLSFLPGRDKLSPPFKIFLLKESRTTISASETAGRQFSVPCNRRQAFFIGNSFFPDVSVLYLCWESGKSRIELLGLNAKPLDFKIIQDSCKINTMPAIQSSHLDSESCVHSSEHTPYLTNSFFWVETSASTKGLDTRSNLLIAMNLSVPEGRRIPGAHLSGVPRCSAVHTMEVSTGPNLLRALEFP